MKKLLVLFVLWLAILPATILAADVRREIELPNLPGYQTLKCDLHMHTMFSDGSVWPTVRVDEAWRQGLDAMALTDHIEYQPHKNDVPTNFNRPYELAAGKAREANLLFPKGAEITRDTPPGHFNAIFLKEIDPLATDDLVEAIGRANQQGAFVFWNHQGWKGSEKGRWLDVHTTLYEKKYLHGMEICNGNEYYPEAHAWCLEKGLTMLGNSDIHAPDLRRQSTAADHRTMTLVLAKDRTLDGLKEALVAGRTAVWFHEQLIARREILEPLFAGCIRVETPHMRSANAVYVHVRNVSDLDIELTRTGNVGPASLSLPARSTSILRIATGKPDEAMTLSYVAPSFLIAPATGLPVTLEIPGP